MAPPRIPQLRDDLRRAPSIGARAVGDAIRLAANEWPEPTPMGRYLTAGDMERVVLNRYPGSGPATELREILAARYGVAPDQLTFGNGSTDTLLGLFLMFGGHGRTTLVFTPTFPIHMRLATIAGGAVARENVGLPYEISAERALAAVERTAPHVVLFCTPNNPTGGLIGDQVILSVAERYPGTLVLVDEAYGDIAGTTLLPALADHPNLVISKTFSKEHAAAGLRMGILVYHPDLAEAVRAAQLPTNVSVVTYALATRIARDEGTIRSRIAEIRSERERVRRGLSGIEGVEPFPSEANFILFRVGGDPVRVYDRFLDEGVLLREMSSWGCPGCLRVSIGTPAENDRFLAVAARVLAPTPA
ncbi:MAG: aminotransferase class I/II-fold pyridoxal phosphate-dependent enzyme [Chloroflexota bacterium]|nr:aminotransferase class I/II-fold pyridoxal phosphate-dependent enzyme [Chloroflexota bacterium]